MRCENVKLFLRGPLVVYDRVATLRHAPFQGVVVQHLLLPPFHELLRFELLLFLGTHRGGIIRRTNGRVKPCSLHCTRVTLVSVFALLFFARACLLENRQIQLRRWSLTAGADRNQGEHEQGANRGYPPLSRSFPSNQHVSVSLPAGFFTPMTPGSTLRTSPCSSCICRGSTRTVRRKSGGFPGLGQSLLRRRSNREYRQIRCAPDRPKR
jgi:hypothetical protein